MSSESSEFLALAVSAANAVGEDAPQRPDYVGSLSFELIASPNDAREAVLAFFQTARDAYVVNDSYEIVADVYGSNMHACITVNIYQDLIEFVRTTGDGFVFNDIYMLLKDVLLTNNIIRPQPPRQPESRQRLCERAAVILEASRVIIESSRPAAEIASDN